MTLVMKFGGASVATPEHFSKIAEIILQRKEFFSGLVVVVSAMSRMTDDLFGLAKRVHPDPPKREVDMLVSVGERISISLLAMALALKGHQAISFTGSQSGIITTGAHNQAKILDVRPERISEALQNKRIVIVAGFQGVSRDKDITTLGRGGSDTSAVALAAALEAKWVEFYKDVDGIYTEDPKIDKQAKKKIYLSDDEAVCFSHKKRILHERALRLAKKNAIGLHLRSFLNPSLEGTIIGGGEPLPQKPIYEQEEINNEHTAHLFI